MLFRRSEKDTIERDRKVSEDEISVDNKEKDEFTVLVEQEKDHDIKYRTLTWQKTAYLLVCEYFGLASMALPWSFSVLGWGTAMTVLIVAGLVTWYTSYIMWKFCMKHPGMRDVGDVAAKLFPAFPRTAREITSVMLIINSVLTMGYHIFTGGKIFSTLADGRVCTVVWQVITMALSILFSLPRRLDHASLIGTSSVIVMSLTILLSLIFAGVQDHPYRGYGGPEGLTEYPGLGPVKTHAGFPNPNLGFIDGFNAVLNIIFAWIGQLLYPSFINEMRDPREFPKALAVLTGCEIVFFVLMSVIGYYFLGQYAQAPFIASLQHAWMRKVAYGLAIVPTIIIGVLYSNVTVKVVYSRIFGNTRHNHSHTILGWGAWIAGITIYWVLAFIFGNVIPSLGDFLSLLCALFDSFFGFIYWAVAFWHLYHRQGFFTSPRRTAETFLNTIIFLFGWMILGPGLWTAVSAIIKDYSGPVAKAFNCAANQL